MDIVHGIEIETTPDKLYDALTTEKGIAAWWTKAKMSANVGEINEFAFGSGGVTFRIEKLQPGKLVAWTAVGVPAEWKDTEVIFEVTPARDSVILRFSHRGFATDSPFVAKTSYAWAQYIRSLKLFLETGKGEPFNSAPSRAAGTTPRR